MYVPIIDTPKALQLSAERKVQPLVEFSKPEGIEPVKPDVYSGASSGALRQIKVQPGLAQLLSGDV
jgi:hypothetical protein